MRKLATSLVIGVALLGCDTPRGAQVPLRTATADEQPGYATFANFVVDVAADPETGTPDTASWRWPYGYTAWRFGSETEVLDASGTRVLVTGHRYHLYIGQAGDNVIVRVEPCPPGTCLVHRIWLWLAGLVLIGTIPALLALVFLGTRVSTRTGPLCPAPNAVQVCATALPTHDTRPFCGNTGRHTLPPTCRGG